jgi:hypothetical protein
MSARPEHPHSQDNQFLLLHHLSALYGFIGSSIATAIESSSHEYEMAALFAVFAGSILSFTYGSQKMKELGYLSSCIIFVVLTGNEAAHMQELTPLLFIYGGVAFGFFYMLEREMEEGIDSLE